MVCVLLQVNTDLSTNTTVPFNKWFNVTVPFFPYWTLQPMSPTMEERSRIYKNKCRSRGVEGSNLQLQLFSHILNIWWNMWFCSLVTFPSRASAVKWQWHFFLAHFYCTVSNIQNKNVLLQIKKHTQFALWTISADIESTSETTWFWNQHKTTEWSQLNCHLSVIFFKHVL